VPFLSGVHSARLNNYAFFFFLGCGSSEGTKGEGVGYGCEEIFIAPAVVFYGLVIDDEIMSLTYSAYLYSTFIKANIFLRNMNQGKVYRYLYHVYCFKINLYLISMKENILKKTEPTAAGALERCKNQTKKGRK
jgi:hypothetical protein